MKTKNLIVKNAFLPVILILLFIFAGLSSCKKYNKSAYVMPGPVGYSGSFVKSKSTVVTSATGTTTASFDPNTNELSYTLNWTNLGSAPIEIHFHDNVNGDGKIILPITGFPTTTSGTVTGKAMLTAAQANDLAAGKLYTQIHTQNYPDGEVLAILTATGGSTNPSTNPSGY